VKAGDSTKLAADSAAWTRNANQIAAFLHGANPDNWPLGDMRSMMHRHLRLTTREAVAELSGDFTASVRAYDPRGTGDPGHGRHAQHRHHPAIPPPVRLTHGPPPPWRRRRGGGRSGRRHRRERTHPAHAGHQQH
jgi:hypothetical protein